MGRYKHEGKGRNISVGGGQERKDLFKDMSGGYNAMGDSNDPSPLYNYGGNSVAKRYSKGPLELTAKGKKAILASDANPEFKSAIAKQPIEMKGSPMHQGKNSRKGYDTMRGSSDKKYAKLMVEPKGSMKGLNKKTAPKISPSEPKQNARIETRMKTVRLTWPGSSRSPYKQMGDPNKKMDRLSARHKSLYDRFEMGQTSEAEEQRMYRLEDRMDKVGKKIKKKK